MDGTILGDIDTDDITKLLEILKTIIIPVNTYNPKPNRNMGRAKSFGTHRGMVLGYIKKRGAKPNDPFQLSRCSKKYPILYNKLVEISQKYFPELKYSAIQVNQNVVCPKHTDPKNTGVSVMVTIGEYEGCNLVVIKGVPPLEPPVCGASVARVTQEETEYITKNKIFLFDGSAYPHYNTPLLSGIKYSFVYFSHL
jgi:hypothetical protein